MKSEKILEAIPKLQKLNDDMLDLIGGAIDSCLAVQSIEKATKDKETLNKLVSLAG